MPDGPSSSPHAETGRPPPPSVRRCSASIGLFVVYATGGQPQLEGLLLFVVLGGIGVGIVVWAKRYLPARPVQRAAGPDRVDRRGASRLRRATSRRAARSSPAEASSPSSPAPPSPRSGIAAIFPIRSLGPAPGRRPEGDAVAQGQLAPGRRGRRADRGRPSWTSTAWSPSSREGHTDAADAPTLLIRLRPGTNQPAPGREGYAAGDLVAYSKLCTAPRVPGRALPGPGRPAALPVPPVDLRRPAGVPAGVRAGDPAAAAAADRRSTPRATSWPRATSAARSVPASGTGAGQRD